MLSTINPELHAAMRWMGPAVWEAVSPVITRVMEIWQTPLHTFYTDHTLSHSARILVKLEALATQLADPLNEQELLLLAAASCLHDVGMQHSKDSSDLNQVRAVHHEVSAQWIVNSLIPATASEWPSLGLENLRYAADDIAIISAGHRVRLLSDADYDDHHLKDMLVRRRLLAGMLRLADALDMDFRRVSIDRLKTQNVPAESRVHWWKCHFVRSIVIRTADNSIEIELGVAPDANDETINILRAAIQTDILKALSETEKILQPVRLVYEEPRISRSPLIEMMTPEDLLNLWDIIQREWHGRAEPEPKYFAALNRQLEQFPERLVRQADALPDDQHEQKAILHQQAAQEYEKLLILNRASDEYQVAAQAYESASDKLSAYHCLISAGTLRSRRTNFDYAHSLFSHARQLAFELQQSALRDAASVLANSALASLGWGPSSLAEIPEGELAALDATHRFTYVHAHAWSLANTFSWTEGADALTAVLEQMPKDSFRQQATFDAAYMQARAGRAFEAIALADEALGIANELLPHRPGHLASAQAQAAYLQYICGQHLESQTTLEHAVELADESGDERARTIHRHSHLHLTWRTKPGAMPDELYTYASFQPRLVSPYERAQLDEYQGLQHQSEGKQRDALLSYYKSWRQRLQNGDFVGIEQAERRIAQVMGGAGDHAQAVLRHAHSGSLVYLDKYGMFLSRVSPDQAQALLHQARLMATTTEARVGLAKLLEQLWDRLPDSSVREYLQLLAEWSDAPFHMTPEINLPLQSLKALRVLCLRADDALAFELTQKLLGDVSQNAFWTVTRARLECLGSVFCEFKLGDLVPQFLSILRARFEETTTTPQVIEAIGMIHQLYPQYRDETVQDLRTRARSGNKDAANLLVQLAGDDTSEEDISTNLIEYQATLKRYADHSSSDSISYGLNLGMLVYYSRFLDKDDPGATARMLFQAASNPALMLGSRQNALIAMQTLVELLSSEERDRMWPVVWQMAFGEIAYGEGVKMTLDSQHPFSNVHMNFGSLEDIVIAARFCLYHLAVGSEPSKRALLRAILKGHFKADTSAVQQHNISLIARLAASGTAADKQISVLVAHWALHHQREGVVRTMLEALADLVPAVSKKDSAALLDGIAAVFSRGNGEIRLTLVGCLSQLASDGFVLPLPLREVVASAHDDPSWQVRRASAELEQQLQQT